MCDIECCANCENCIDLPKNNRYGDVEHYCLATGYFTHGIYKDRNKIRHFTPGGKELECKYKRKKEKYEIHNKKN